MVGRLKSAVPKAEPEAEIKGFFKAKISRATPDQQTCFAEFLSPQQDIRFAVLVVGETKGADLLRNKGGGSFVPKQLITILKMRKLGNSFTALEIA